MAIRIAVFLVLLCGFPLSAAADTDYSCLNHCNSGDCMKQCSYNTEGVDKKNPAKNPHNPFPDQYVANGITLPKPTAAKQLEKDFPCVSACLKEGMQYGLCQERCTHR